MKIKNLKLENFAKYSHIEVSFDENVTYLIGNNGAGKTTLGLNAVWFILQGIAEKGLKGTIPLIAERFRFIGDEAKSARGEMTLVDSKKGVEIKVIRKLTKDGTQLSFEAPQGMNLDQNWLNDLFNIFLIAPKTFIELDSRKQAEVLGIDTSDYDKKLEELKSEYTFINREIKTFGELKEVEKVEAIDISLLIAEKNKIIEFNSKQTELAQDIKRNLYKMDSYQREAEELSAQIDMLQNKLLAIQSTIGAGSDYISKLPRPQPEIDTKEIDERIKLVNENNTKVSLYRFYLNEKARYDSKVSALNYNKTRQEETVQSRLEYIRSKQLPFQDLEINEKGELLLSGKPIKEPYFATGELLKVVPILMSSLNPELKYVFIQQFNLLDEYKQKEIEEYLVSKGFQIVAEIVGERDVKDKHCLLLRDMKLV